VNQRESKTKANLNITILPFVLLVIGIGSAEYIILQFLPWLQSVFPGVSEVIIGSVLLSIAIAPIVYLIIRKNISTLALDKSSIRNKLILSSGLPLIIAIALMLNIINQKQAEISTLQFTKLVTEFDETFGRFIKAYSKEIELSTLYLINNQQSEANALIEHRLIVKRLAAKVKEYVLVKGVNVGRFEEEFINHFYSSLEELRLKVDEKSIKWPNLIDFILASNHELLTRLSTFSGQIQNKDINKRHVNLLALIKLESINNVTHTILSASTASEQANGNQVDIRPMKAHIRFKNSHEKTYLHIFKSSLIVEHKEDLLAKLEIDVFQNVALAQSALEEKE
jgi:hypothetical protein